MKRTFLSAIMVVISLSLISCGGGGGGSAPPPTIVTQILSNSAVDGDIQVTLAGSIIIRQNNTQSVFAGIDPVTFDESRAFLDFSLSTVPLNASIVSATLIIFINDIQPSTGTIPIRIDLVSFSELSGSDFDSTPIATPIAFPVFQTDFKDYVAVDVTSLMAQAQNLFLPHFQIRILLDFSAASGLIEINDTTGFNRVALAPLLQVEYF